MLIVEGEDAVTEVEDDVVAVHGLRGDRRRENGIGGRKDAGLVGLHRVEGGDNGAVGDEVGAVVEVAVVGGGITSPRDLVEGPEPRAVRPGGEQADVAQEALGGAVAVAVAQDAPADVGVALLESAHDAFVSGMHVTAGATAVVLAATALPVHRLMRSR